MKNEILITDDILNLDGLKDKIEVILNDIERYFDDGNAPADKCERRRYDMEITRIGIMHDYINSLEKIVNDMYDHVKMIDLISRSEMHE